MQRAAIHFPVKRDRKRDLTAAHDHVTTALPYTFKALGA